LAATVTMVRIADRVVLTGTTTHATPTGTLVLVPPVTTCVIAFVLPRRYEQTKESGQLHQSCFGEYRRSG
jgi:hypothetical protein